MAIKRYEVMGKIKDRHDMESSRRDFLYSQFLPKYREKKISCLDGGESTSSYGIDGAVVSLKDYSEKGLITITGADREISMAKSRIEGDLEVVLGELEDERDKNKDSVVGDDSPYGSGFLAGYRY